MAGRHGRAAGTAKAAEIAAFRFGASAIGPILCGLDALAAQRHAALARAGRWPAVLFPTKDAALSRQIWRMLRDTPAYTLDIARRPAPADAPPAPRPDFLRGLRPAPEESTTSAALRAAVEISAFFACHPGSLMGGAAPELLRDLFDEPACVADQEMLRHLRCAIPAFDGRTDLILVDPGLTRDGLAALRAVLDSVGLDHRLHGLTLLADEEDAFLSAAGDSLTGLLSGPQPSAVAEALKGLQALFGAHVGDFGPVYSPDPWHALQSGILDCALGRRSGSHAATGEAGDAILAGAAMLMRLLLLPAPKEEALIAAVLASRDRDAGRDAEPALRR